MEKYSVNMIESAYEDIDNIYAYLSRQSLELESIRRIVYEIDDGILSLQEMPYRCSIRKSGIYSDNSFRQLFIKSYIIIFKIEDNSKSVVVFRVLHSSIEI